MPPSPSPSRSDNKWGVSLHEDFLMARRLPLEVFLEIVAYLDNFSIIQILKAYPGLQSLAILLTTNEDGKPRFIDLECGQSAMFNFIGPMKESQVRYNSQVHGNYPIKIVEIDHEEEWREMRMRELSRNAESESGDYECFDSTTFAFIKDQEMYENLMVRFATRSTHLSVGLRRQPSPPSHCTYMCLGQLHIESTGLLRGLQLPVLYSLEVVFQSPAPGVKEVPGIRDLYAPSLERLRIHYNRVFPDLTNVGTLGSSENRWDCHYEFSDYRFVEICDVRTLATNGISYAGLDHDPETDFHGIDPNMLNNFSRVMLLGTPKRVLQETNFLVGSRCFIFKLVIALKENWDDFPVRVLTTRRVRRLHIEVNVRGCRVPAFLWTNQYGETQPVPDVKIFINAPNVRLEDFMVDMIGSFEKPGGYRSYIRRFGLFVNPNMQQLLMGDQHKFVLTQHQWEMILEGYYHDITLSGFEMPFLEDGRPNVISMCDRILNLCPLIHDSNDDQLMIHNGAIKLSFNLADMDEARDLDHLI